MKFRPMFMMLLVLTAFLTVTVSPAFAAVDDTLEALGFDVNSNYDVKEDLTLQKGFDIASSIPLWGVFIIVILILVVLCVLVVPSVFGFNVLKGGRAAVNENPTKAAQGIKDARDTNRHYFIQLAEGGFFIACVVFVVGLFL